MSNTPKLAIIIPAYKATFLKQTLDAFEAQTCHDFNLYIGDDCFITDNPNNYTDKILTLLKSPSLQHEFVNKSRENFNKSYSATTLGQKRLDILKSIN